MLEAMGLFSRRLSSARTLRSCASKLGRGSALACTVALALAFSKPARAEPLRIDASAERMRVDGALREWRGARFSELGSGDDGSLQYAFASADGGLYLAAEVRDERLVTGPKGDALVLLLAMPDGSTWHSSELWLYPGEAGRSKASASVRVGDKLKPETRVQVVEGPRAKGGGYVIEAFVPWSLVRGAEIWEQGRGALRFVDVDAAAAAPERTLASAQAKSAGELPRLALGVGQNDLLGSFMADKKLSGVEPRYDFRANVAADPRPERVVIIGDFVVVYGPGYKRGETYGYFALPYSIGGGLKSAELRDVTGDGSAELITVVRQRNDLGARELWMALDMAEDGIAPVFAVELKKELKGGTIDNTLRLIEGRGAPRIEVKVGRAQGLDGNTYAEATAADAQPILLPWGEIEARTYAFDGTRFAVVDEKRKARTLSAPEANLPERNVAAKSGKGDAAVARAEPGAVLALFKAQQKLPAAAKPMRSFQANLLGGAHKEQVDVFGSMLAITGPEIAQGTGYVAYGVPVGDARDVLDVRAAELTGDGHDELLVRIAQPLSGSEQATRELVLVLRADASGRVSRALMAEVARRTAQGSIENRVRSERGALVIEPGSARGFTADNYPFAPDGVGGAAPLLLPWRDRPVRYVVEGARLVPAR